MNTLQQLQALTENEDSHYLINGFTIIKSQGTYEVYSKSQAEESDPTPIFESEDENKIFKFINQ